MNRGNSTRTLNIKTSDSEGDSSRRTFWVKHEGYVDKDGTFWEEASGGTGLRATAGVAGRRGPARIPRRAQ